MAMEAPTCPGNRGLSHGLLLLPAVAAACAVVADDRQFYSRFAAARVLRELLQLLQLLQLLFFSQLSFLGQCSWELNS